MPSYVFTASHRSAKYTPDNHRHGTCFRPRAAMYRNKKGNKKCSHTTATQCQSKHEAPEAHKIQHSRDGAARLDLTCSLGRVMFASPDLLCHDRNKQSAGMASEDEGGGFSTMLCPSWPEMWGSCNELARVLVQGPRANTTASAGRTCPSTWTPAGFPPLRYLCN